MEMMDDEGLLLQDCLFDSDLGNEVLNCRSMFRFFVVRASELRGNRDERCVAGNWTILLRDRAVAT